MNIICSFAAVAFLEAVREGASVEAAFALYVTTYVAWTLALRTQP